MKLKPVSEQLQTFIKNNFKNNISDIPSLSDVSRDFLKLIYSLIKIQFFRENR